MRVRISRSTEWKGEEEGLEESFHLEVEREAVDLAEATAGMYLKLREMLINGLKEGANAIN